MCNYKKFQFIIAQFVTQKKKKEKRKKGLRILLSIKMYVNSPHPLKKEMKINRNERVVFFTKYK